jgi:hypothetical protein
MHRLQAGEHVHCLDVLKVAFPSAPGRMSHDCAILLEIWDHGALLQTTVEIQEGLPIAFESIGEGVPAKVVSCEQDSYGFLVQVAVGETRWFPDGYTPPHVMWPDLPS